MNCPGDFTAPRHILTTGSHFRCYSCLKPLDCYMSINPNAIEGASAAHPASWCAHAPQVIGGVTEPNAWVDTEHNFGALFMRDKVVATGAVGAFLRGPLTLTQLTAPSYRPVGSPARVTSAAGNLILGLDGAAVHEAFPQMYDQLTEGERQAEVALGVEVGPPGEWVTRGMSLMMGPGGRPVLAVAVAEVRGRKGEAGREGRAGAGGRDVRGWV